MSSLADCADESSMEASEADRRTHLLEDEADLSGYGDVLRMIATQMSEGVALIDEEGLFCFVNEAASRLAGCDPDELIGLHYSAMVHPDDHPVVLRRLAASLSGTSDGEPTRFRWRTTDGRWRCLEAVASNLLDVEGVAAVFVTTRAVDDPATSDWPLGRTRSGPAAIEEILLA